MFEFNPKNIKAYFGYTIETRNSKYFISLEGKIKSNSKAFIINKEFDNADLIYIGSLSKEKENEATKYIQKLQNKKGNVTEKELGEILINYLEEVKTETSLAIGFKTINGTINNLQTSKIIKIYAPGNTQDFDYFIVKNDKRDEFIDNNILIGDVGAEKKDIVELINKYEGQDLNALSTLAYAAEQGKFKEYFDMLIKFAPTIKDIPLKDRRDNNFIEAFFLSCYKVLGIEPVK